MERPVKRQARSYWCGVASIANALEVLGIRRSQREVERLCHVSPEAGTDEVEMKRALLANGMAVDEWSSKDLDDTIDWLTRHLASAGPAVLCVDDWEHWVTAIGLCGDAIVLYDPSRNHGVEVHTAQSLAHRWASEGIYYGIGLSSRS